VLLLSCGRWRAMDLFRARSRAMTTLPNEQIAGTARRWRFSFRYRGPRRESVVAQLSA
jgi:hypothetical protein